MTTPLLDFREKVSERHEKRTREGGSCNHAEWLNWLVLGQLDAPNEFCIQCIYSTLQSARIFYNVLRLVEPGGTAD